MGYEDSLTVKPRRSMEIVRRGNLLFPRGFLARLRESQDQAREMLNGRCLRLTNTKLVMSVAVPHHPASLRPDQVWALEHARACRALDRTPAGERATELLFSYLTPEQRKTAVEDMFIDAYIYDKPQAEYTLAKRGAMFFQIMKARIYRGWPNGNIELSGTDRGEPFMLTVCLHPTSPYPTDDIVLSQLLTFYNDPNAFVKLGNSTYEGSSVPLSFERMFGVYRPKKLVTR